MCKNWFVPVLTSPRVALFRPVDVFLPAKAPAATTAPAASQGHGGN